jgi:glycosyltransferase involved in cell wall biosynthesis
VTSAGRYAIIPTHNRPAELAACIAGLDGVDTIMVIDNASEPPVETYALAGAAHTQIVIVYDDEQPPNLSRLWNVGLDHVANLAAAAGQHEWDVAILNDDAVVPPGWFTACATAMRAGPAIVACSGAHGTLPAPLLKTAPDRDIWTRMCPHAFVTRGEAGLRSDESMRWWFFDTSFDFEARISGGVQLIAGYPTSNTRANSSTVGVLAEQAGRDRETFEAKHGWVPW